MAKRRKKRARARTRTKTVTKYRTRSVARRGRSRGRRRGGGGGMLGGIMPSRHELYDMAGAGAYGLLEKKAREDANFFVHKVVAKSPLPSLGMAGNVALAARLANKFAFKSPLLGHLAQGAACVAIYQMARQGKTFDNVQPFVVQGDGDDIAGYVDEETMGALAADADAYELDGGDEDDYDIEGDDIDDEIVDNVSMGFED